MNKIAVLGSGMVGEALANGFLKHGHEVMRASREPAKLADWQKSAGDKAKIGTFEEAAKYGDVVVLAVKGDASEEAIRLAGGDATLAGKTVIDTTNPIGGGPPKDGVLSFFTTMNDSLMERLQKKFAKVHFVKAFNSVGSGFMVNPKFPGGTPTMFICGDDEGAKKQVRTILDAFGWETEDMGASIAARAIEPLCILWCIPGLTKNQWTHAFKLLKL